jgi:methylenetetrahydrofolate dehydrogenase (NADP+)/methenyltetrahydrofolate cyclohydrolase
MAILLDGKKVAEKILKPVRKEILKLKKKGIVPFLSIILVGKEDPNSLTYIREKRKKAREIGVLVKVYKFDKEIQADEIKKLITKLNKNPSIHGILVQLPLPKNLDTEAILQTIDPKKDVDGLLPSSPYQPACASGILKILSFYKIPVKNKKVIIVGAGRIIGQPLFKLMKNKGIDVTLIESKTKNLESKTKKADILIGATPIKNIIKSSMVKKGTVVIDAAKNVQKDVKKIASYLTPKIGGVGPTTVAELLKNVVKAAQRA